MDLDRALNGRSGIATFGFAVGVLAICTMGAATALLLMLRSTAEVGITLGSNDPPHVAACVASDDPLIAAAALREHDEVRHLIDEGAAPNVTDDDGTTPLACAVRTNDEAMVRLLLAAGANPNSRGTNGNPVLLGAVDRCNVAVAEQLLDAGSDLDATDGAGRTPLQLALIYGDAPMLLLLLERGAEDPGDLLNDPWRVTRERSWLVGCGLGDVVHPARAVLDGLDAGNEPNTFLLEAIALGLPWLVEEALAAGADPAAVQSIRPGSLASTFDPSLAHYFWLLELSDEERPAPPLLEEVMWEIDPVGMRGLNKGAPIITPALLLAAWRGDERIVRLLLDAGADPNAASTGGYTALHAAAVNGCSDCTSVLREAGAVAPDNIISPEELLARRQWASLALFEQFEGQ